MAKGIVFGGPTGGVTSFIKNVQYGSVDLQNTTSNTANIDAVVLANSYIQYLGETEGETSTFGFGMTSSRVVLTNTTTVTATRGASNDQVHDVQFCVVEFEEGIINSNQVGTITLSSPETTDTDTIDAVVIAKTMLILSGNSNNWTDTDDPDEFCTHITLTNTTTVTATRINGGLSDTITVGYQAIEFN